MRIDESSNAPLHLPVATGRQRGSFMTLTLLQEEAILTNDLGRELGRWTRDQANTRFIFPGWISNRRFFVIQWDNGELAFRLSHEYRHQLNDWLHGDRCDRMATSMVTKIRRSWM